jgi:hypothetical protein
MKQQPKQLWQLLMTLLTKHMLQQEIVQVQSLLAQP